jgi:RimJ/RimL family protein N-acetyltransferase
MEEIEIGLEVIDDGDLNLYESMFCDPEYMKDLGGPHPKEKVDGILNNQLSCVTNGKGLVYKIVVHNHPDSPNEKVAVGTCCIWKGYYKDEIVSELGYGILCKYQGCGYATKGIALILNIAKEDPKWGKIHAFTSVNNIASNRVLSKLGFTNIEEYEIDYDGRMILSNHWVCDA